MAGNIALSVKQPQHSSSRGGAPDHHQYAWQLKADRDCKADGGHGTDESSNSWEARAFAEDASSLAAGIWPPRAYPCSFCRREFRSAQALGGHMNVHRRDRARLRQSSPPPPFHASHNIPLHPSTIIHKSQHEYSSTTLNPSTCPKIYPNEFLSKVNAQLPTTLSFSTISPKSSTTSLAAKYPSHMATSFPLRLQLLASEAASTLMLRQAESSDLLSLWPASALDSRNGCRSTMSAGIKGSAIDISSSSSSSTSTLLSCEVAPSMGATPCRRASHSAPDIQPEDESPKKKSNVTNNYDIQPYQIIKLVKNSSMDDGICHAQDKQNLTINNVDDSMSIQRAREACSEFVDLELRLGQRPP